MAQETKQTTYHGKYRGIEYDIVTFYVTDDGKVVPTWAYYIYIDIDLLSPEMQNRSWGSMRKAGSHYRLHAPCWIRELPWPGGCTFFERRLLRSMHYQSSGRYVKAGCDYQHGVRAKQVIRSIRADVQKTIDALHEVVDYVEQTNL